MLRADYTTEERETFQKLRCHYPDTRIQRRFEILWFHSCGKFAPEIALLVQQNPVTVRKVIKNYQAGGTELVARIEYHQPTGELEKHILSTVSNWSFFLCILPCVPCVLCG